MVVENSKTKKEYTYTLDAEGDSPSAVLENFSLAGYDRILERTLRGETEFIPEDLDVDEPLFIDDAETTASYNPRAVKQNTIIGLTELHPDRTYVYNAAFGNTITANGDPAFATKNVPNSMGLTTQMSYSGKEKSMEDGGTGLIDPTNKAAIDDAIREMEEAVASGQILVFNKQGYGQEMIGADTEIRKVTREEYNKESDQPGVREAYTDVVEKKINGKSKIVTNYFIQRGPSKKRAVAEDTFLYLSKQLLDKFGYINPNFLGTEYGLAQVQEEYQELSDSAVQDLITICKTL